MCQGQSYLRTLWIEFAGVKWGPGPGEGIEVETESDGLMMPERQ